MAEKVPDGVEMGSHSRVTFSISFSIGKVGEVLTLHFGPVLGHFVQMKVPSESDMRESYVMPMPPPNVTGRLAINELTGINTRFE